MNVCDRGARRVSLTSAVEAQPSTFVGPCWSSSSSASTRHPAERATTLPRLRILGESPADPRRIPGGFHGTTLQRGPAGPMVSQIPCGSQWSRRSSRPHGPTPQLFRPRPPFSLGCLPLALPADASEDACTTHRARNGAILGKSVRPSMDEGRLWMRMSEAEFGEVMKLKLRARGCGKQTKRALGLGLCSRAEGALRLRGALHGWRGRRKAGSYLERAVWLENSLKYSRKSAAFREETRWREEGTLPESGLAPAQMPTK
jgi:hypothetical protein